MSFRRYAVPAVEINAQKDCFQKEGKTFQGKWHSNDGTGPAHEVRPEQTEFEGQDGARDRSYGKQNGGSLGPALRQVEVNRVAGSLPTPFCDHHEHRHRYAYCGKDNVKTERHGHLSTSCQQITHVWPFRSKRGWVLQLATTRGSLGSGKTVHRTVFASRLGW